MAKTETTETTEETTEINQIAPDNPLVEPQQDRLGYAPFAQHLAESICNMSVAEGFVMAVYGSWGSGKSTLMNFIVHYLKQKPEEEQPIVVPFNPWLFSGYQDITRRFFDQLQNVLTKETYVSKGIRERISDFAKVVAEIPLPYAQVGRAVATAFDDKQKEASELKEEVEVTLTRQDRRILVAIDDIDRLDADDIKQLFRLLKAIPNFTNVVYLLVFDQQAVFKALKDVQGESAEAYLDKIVQVAFKLPKPDKTSIRRLLFEKLNSVLADTPKELFEPTYWGNVYFQGIDHFITNLRDMVRLTNTLTAIYPVVKGEVNPVDFIAIESLRVFCPMVYDIIRKNKNAFVGEENSSLDELQNMHNSWLALLPEQDKEPVKKLLMNLFPKLEFVWANSSYKKSQESRWCRQLRVCCDEIFPIYFRLTLSESKLSDNEIQAILASANDAKAFGEKLIELANQIRPDGTTQVRAFLERLENFTEKEIPPQSIPSIVTALFDVGEQLLRPEDEPTTMFDFGNEIRISRIVSQLLHRLEEPVRFEVLKTAVSQGKAFSIIESEVATLAALQDKNNSDKSLPEEEWLISLEHLQELKEIVAKRQQDKRL
ncbi:KAP family NTPase [Iningainema tapete]|uniref:AAA family ATPase n=1 Tax=Iningainema tapete BLCC-T55 TaxID=2748662 RepID=A0A8J7C3W0_9CYAN|nr:P-loop NTPase fold protein [Iningainema tapete]MBD2770549.1 AAA family ATPase [Iningainema tapete BLCC-T55]